MISEVELNGYRRRRAVLTREIDELNLLIDGTPIVCRVTTIEHISGRLRGVAAWLTGRKIPRSQAATVAREGLEIHDKARDAAGPASGDEEPIP